MFLYRFGFSYWCVSLCFFSLDLFSSIDVVIPCVEKDLATLELCIEGIKKNGQGVNRIIVVSSRPLTAAAEWCDEGLFPFSKQDIADHIFRDAERALQYVRSKPNRIGWIYQQLLKLYSIFVIPDISDHVLVVDADTIFLRPVTFVDEEGNALYNPGSEYHTPYFEHASRLMTGFYRVHKEYSGISHHMLFQRNVLQDLFDCVAEIHAKPFWQAFCDCISLRHVQGSSASEYEIYFNFIFSHDYPVKMRKLRWANVKFSEFNMKKGDGYDYLSCHAYL